jgi:hypothetical protein
MRYVSEFTRERRPTGMAREFQEEIAAELGISYHNLRCRVGTIRGLYSCDHYDYTYKVCRELDAILAKGLGISLRKFDKANNRATKKVVSKDNLDIDYGDWHYRFW